MRELSITEFFDYAIGVKRTEWVDALNESEIDGSRLGNKASSPYGAWFGELPHGESALRVLRGLKKPYVYHTRF